MVSVGGPMNYTRPQFRWLGSEWMDRFADSVWALVI